jgi:hypothetical protein
MNRMPATHSSRTIKCCKTGDGVGIWETERLSDVALAPYYRFEGMFNPVLRLFWASLEPTGTNEAPGGLATRSIEESTYPFFSSRKLINWGIRKPCLAHRVD